MGKLWFWYSSQGKEVCTKPNFLDVCLMSILSDNLFDSKLFSTFDMFAQPNKTEATSAQEFNFLESEGESVSKNFLFLFSQSISFIRMFWPFRIMWLWCVLSTLLLLSCFLNSFHCLLLRWLRLLRLTRFHFPPFVTNFNLLFIETNFPPALALPFAPSFPLPLFPAPFPFPLLWGLPWRCSFVFWCRALHFCV